jgi:hypothetical protein
LFEERVAELAPMVPPAARGAAVPTALKAVPATLVAKKLVAKKLVAKKLAAVPMAAVLPYPGSCPRFGR